MSSSIGVAAVKQTPRIRHRGFDIPTAYISFTNIPSATRRLWVSSLIGFAISPITGYSAAHAQIPSMDEFYVTSGTKIRDVSKSAAVVDTVGVLDKNKLKSGLTLSKVYALKPLIQSAQWEDLIAQIKYYKPLFAPYFGYSSIQDLSASLGGDVSSANRVDSLRDDTSFVLKQLDDVAISSRAVYFNKEDLKQVQGMYVGDSAKLREDANINEAMDLYASVESSFEALIKAL